MLNLKKKPKTLLNEVRNLVAEKRKLGKMAAKPGLNNKSQKLVREIEKPKEGTMSRNLQFQEQITYSRRQLGEIKDP